MEASDRLVPRQSVITKSSTHSLQPQEITLLKEMRLTALNAKIVPSEDLNEEYLRVLSSFPAEAIEYAFRSWRNVSPFFPAISEVRDLCVRWIGSQAEIREEQEQARRRKEEAEARERGELITWPQVLHKFNDIVSRDAAEKLKNKAVMPEVPPNAEIVISQDRREMIQQQVETIKKRYQK